MGCCGLSVPIRDRADQLITLAPHLREFILSCALEADSIEDLHWILLCRGYDSILEIGFHLLPPSECWNCNYRWKEMARRVQHYHSAERKTMSFATWSVWMDYREEADKLNKVYPEYKTFFDSICTLPCSEDVTYYERMEICTKMIELRKTPTVLAQFVAELASDWYLNYLHQLPHMPAFHPRMVDTSLALENIVPRSCTYLHKAIRESVALKKIQDIAIANAAIINDVIIDAQNIRVDMPKPPTAELDTSAPSAIDKGIIISYPANSALSEIIDDGRPEGCSL